MLWRRSLERGGAARAVLLLLTAVRDLEGVVGGAAGARGRHGGAAELEGVDWSLGEAREARVQATLAAVILVLRRRRRCVRLLSRGKGVGVTGSQGLPLGVGRAERFRERAGFCFRDELARIWASLLGRALAQNRPNKHPQSV